VRSLSDGTRRGAIAAAVGCALEEVVEKAPGCVPPVRSLSGGTRRGAIAAAVGCALEGRITLLRRLLQQLLEGRITLSRGLLHQPAEGRTITEP
jgi:hypothetical protein